MIETRTSVRAHALSAVVLIVTLALLTGCSALLAPPPTRAEVLGSWVASEDGHRVRIELHGGGAIRIEGVPRSVLAWDTTDVLNWNDLATFTGEWEFSEATGEAFSEALISVRLSEESGSQSLTLYPRGGGLELYYGDVELSRHLFFEQTAGASTPAPPTVSRADLIGSWVSNSGSELRLYADDTFEIIDAPPAFVTHTDEDGATTPISPVGRWAFNEQPLPLDPEDSTVMLSFDGTYGPSSTYVTKFVRLDGDGADLVLSFHDEARWEKK